VPDPLVGKCFIGPDNKTGNGNVVAGRIVSRIGAMYLVHRQDDPFEGEESLVPLATMAGWRFGDEKWLQGFEVVEPSPLVVVPEAATGEPRA
jgi:hypothetical protein